MIQRRQRVLAVAHRAGNSPAGLHAATDAGVDLVEADVHAHRGRLEVRHLKSLGPSPWQWDRWYLARAPRTPLLLSDLLADPEVALGTGAGLMLDLKGPHPRLAPAVARLLRVRPPARPVVVCSRHWWMLDAFDGSVQARRVYSVRGRHDLTLLPRRLARHPAYGVSVHRSLLTPALVARLHEQVTVVMTWPVNTAGALDVVLSAGVTGVISADLDLLSLVRRRGGAGGP